ncbi:ParB N-terminal domain-containing protein [Pseudonocardia sp. ICBG162]|uniref:ParB/RepB/Spo0J family partition protein n=1 Tax=Pseudonocardia sp. ICBG162 TaxID=2846761 RepID=UPI001CF63FF5|nr:ParB N-terminal domain-containing protein [Pseudonocardia sp. ICBG162]
MEQLDDLAADRDVRTDRGSLDELACSLIVQGLITPLTVVPGEEPDRYVINAGHRRRAALSRAAELLRGVPEEFGYDAESGEARAVELLGRVPCWVRPDLAGRESLTQLAENGDTRRGLSQAERYRGLQLAFGDGLDDREIAQAAGMKPAQVRAARKSSGLPDEAREAIASGQLDLDTAAQLHAFGDDPKATTRILNKYRDNPDQVAHAIAEEQHKRTVAAAVERLKAEAVIAEHAVRTEPKGGLHYGYHGPDELFTHLRHSDGTELTPEIDGGTPGHYAFVERGYGMSIHGGPRLRYACATPDEHGHTRTRTTSYRSPAEVERLETRRRAEEAQREAMAAAVRVRGKFLRSLLGSQKAAAKHVDLLAAIVAQFPGAITHHDRHLLAGELLPAPGQDWTPARLTHHAVAKALLGIDAVADGTSGWRSDRPAGLWWWQTLADLGYERGDAEQAHVAHLAAVVAAETEAEAEERRVRQEIEACAADSEAGGHDGPEVVDADDSDVGYDEPLGAIVPDGRRAADGQQVAEAV